MAKKIAFVQPRIDDGNLIPPIGPLIMAAQLERHGWEVAFFEEQTDPDAFANLLAFRPDIAAFSAVTMSVLRAKMLAEKLKAEQPGVVTVFGGPHPTVMADEVLSWGCADFVIVREGEKSLPLLCDWVAGKGSEAQLDKIPNLCRRRAGKTVRNALAQFLTPQELDALPLPALHLLDINKIFGRMRHGLYSKGKRILPVMGSRGCPNMCTYCCRVMGYHIRTRSLESVLGEVEHLVKDYAIDELWFEDDNFTADRTRAEQILDALSARYPSLAIKFANGLRADGMDRALLEKLKKAGCYSLSFGIESGNERVLSLMRKNLDLRVAAANVKLAKDMGFLVGSNCIIGYPGETEAEARQSIEFFMSLDLDSMAIVNLIPFPGTAVHALCKQNGYLTPLAEDWNNYTFDISSPRVLVQTPELPAAAVRRLMSQAYRKMYLNPRRMLRIARRLDAARLWAGAKFMLGRLLRA